MEDIAHLEKVPHWFVQCVAQDTMQCQVKGSVPYAQQEHSLQMPVRFALFVRKVITPILDPLCAWNVARGILRQLRELLNALHVLWDHIPTPIPAGDVIFVFKGNMPTNEANRSAPLVLLVKLLQLWALKIKVFA